MDYINKYFNEHGIQLQIEELSRFYAIVSYINNKCSMRDDFHKAVRDVYNMYINGWIK